MKGVELFVVLLVVLAALGAVGFILHDSSLTGAQAINLPPEEVVSHATVDSFPFSLALNGYFTDPDLDQLTYATDDPAVSIRGAVAVFNPPAGFTGDYPLIITVSDGTNTVAKPFTLSVIPALATQPRGSLGNAPQNPPAEPQTPVIHSLALPGASVSDAEDNVTHDAERLIQEEQQRQEQAALPDLRDASDTQSGLGVSSHDVSAACPLSITTCCDITSSGSYTLANNISSTGNCIRIQASDVRLDCLNNSIFFGSTTLRTHGINLTDVFRVNITNCNIYGQYPFFNGNLVALSLRNSFDVNLSNSFINNSNATNRGTAVGVFRSARFTMQNTSVSGENNTGAIRFHFSNDSVIINSSILGTGADGFQIDGGRGHNFTQNYERSQFAIELLSSTTQNTITNSNISCINGFGLYLNPASSTVVDNITIVCDPLSSGVPLSLNSGASQNQFRNLNFTPATGGSSNTVFLVGSSNNNFDNLTLNQLGGSAYEEASFSNTNNFSNGHITAGTGIFVSVGSSNNRHTNNTINATVRGIQVGSGGAAPTNNVFTNTTVTGNLAIITNSNTQSRFFNTTISTLNSTFTKGTWLQTGGTANFTNTTYYDPSFGFVRYEGLQQYTSFASVTRNSPSPTLDITNLTVYVNSSNLPNHNTSALVGFYNAPTNNALTADFNDNHGYGSCLGCTRYTSTNPSDPVAFTAVAAFNVTHFTSYQIVDTGFCPTTIVSDTTLNNSVASEGTCVTFGANDITLDCNGSTIIFANTTGNYGIDASGRNNIAIRNCFVSQANPAITSTQGIRLSGTTNAFLDNDHAIVTGDSSIGILATSGGTNLFTNTSSYANGSNSEAYRIGTDTNDDFIVTNATGLNGPAVHFLGAGSNLNRMNFTNANSQSAAGIQLDSAQSNNFTNTFSGSDSSYGLYFAIGADNNLVENATLESNADGAVEFGGGSGGSNNHFVDLTLHTNATWIGVNDPGAANNQFNNTLFEQDDGSIRFPFNFTPAVNSEVTLAELFTAFNQSFVNSTQVPYLNTTAQITLYNVVFSNAGPYVDFDDDGTYDPCFSPQCDEVGYDGSTFIFNVSGFTSYAAAETCPCPGTITDNTTLTCDMRATSNCIDLGADDMFLDCAGHTIDGQNVAGNGIVASGRNNVIVKNCHVENFTEGIYIPFTTNSAFDNNTVALNPTADIHLQGATFNNVTSNNVTQSDRGIFLDIDSDNNLVLFNNMTSNNFGIYVDTADSNTIAFNSMLLSGTNNFGGTTSCPFFYSWNGTGYSFVGDIFGRGILATPIGNGSFKKPNPYDWMKIDSSQLEQNGSHYTVSVAEEQNEMAFVDELGLATIDHSPDFDVYPGGLVKSEVATLYTVSKNLTPVVSCQDQDGHNCLSAVSTKDGVYSGIGDGSVHSLDLDLGPLAGASTIKLVLVAYLGFGGYNRTVNGTNVTYAPKSNATYTRFIRVQNASSEWQEVYNLATLNIADGFPRTYVIDLTGKFPTSDHRIQLEIGSSPFDYIAVDTTDQQPLTINNYTADSADLHFRGYSARSKGQIPYPTYGNVTNSTAYFNPSGNFTKYGDVLPLVMGTDDQFVIMHHGDEMTVTFRSGTPPDVDMVRDYLLYSTGYFKQPPKVNPGGVNGTTVEPLPFFNMSTYPYSPNETYPTDPEHADYLSLYNTRRYANQTQNSAGASLPNSFNNTVANNTIIGDVGATGLQLSSEVNTTLVNNSISGVFDGIGLSSTQGTQIIFNSIFDISDIAITGSETGGNLSSNQINNSVRGITINGANNLIDNNSINTTGGDGIFSFGDGLIVNGNTIISIGGGTRAIALDNFMTGANFTNNYAYSDLGATFDITSFEQDTYVFNNTFVTPDGFGFRINTGADNTQLANNTFLTNATWFDISGGPTNLFGQNNTFQEADGSIQQTGFATIPDGAIANTGNLNIGYNASFIDSFSLPFLNDTGIVTLNGLPFTDAQPLIDVDDTGNFVNCDSPECDLDSYTGGTAVFNVSHFTTYAITGNISSCTCPGSIIADTTLTCDPIGDDTCVSMDADDITLDCAGHTITYNNNGGALENGVFSDTHANLVVKNCIMADNNVAPGDFGTNGIQFNNIVGALITNNTIFSAGDGFTRAIQIDSSTAVNMTNNTLRGNGTSCCNNGLSIQSGTTQYIVSGNVFTSDSTDSGFNHAMSSDGASDGLIENNTASSFGFGCCNAGYNVASGGNVTTQNNSAIADGQDSFNEGVTYTTMTAGLIENNLLISRGLGANNAGIALQTATTQISVTNNSIYTDGTDSNAGVVLVGSPQNRLENNSINSGGSSVANHGVHLIASSDQTVILNNTIQVRGTGGSMGIRVFQSATETIANNSITANTTDGAIGISFESYSNDSISENNTIFVLGDGSDDYGFLVASQSRNNTILRNLAASQSTNGGNCEGIRFSEALDTTVLNNTFTTQGLAGGCDGLEIGTQTNGTLVLSNTIILNGTGPDNDGVTVTGGSSNNTIQNNTISTTGSDNNDGVSFIGAAHDNRAINNTLTANGTDSNHGARIDGADNNTVESNSISTLGTASNNHGIDADNSYDSLITANIISTFGVDSNAGVRVFNSGRTNVTLNDIHSNGSSTNSDGIQVDSGSNDTLIDQNNATADGTTFIEGVSVQGALNTTITGNTLTTFNSGGFGSGVILFNGANHSLVMNNIVTGVGPTVNGFSIGQESHNNTITNNSVNITGDDNVQGARIDDPSSENVIDSNNFQVSATLAGDVVLLSASPHHNNISNNTGTIIGTGNDDGIHLQFGSTDNFVTLNNLTVNGGSTVDGLVFFGGSNNTATDNTFSANSAADGTGLHLLNESSSTLLNNSVITTGTGSNEGILVTDSSANTIQNNTAVAISTTNGDGILISTSNATTVTNNSLSASGGNSVFGAHIQSDSHANTLIGNIISLTSADDGSGIIIIGDSAENTIQNNTVTSNGIGNTDGIHLESNANNNRVLGNTVTATGGLNHDGMISFTATNNTFVNNTVLSTTTVNGFGFRAIDSTNSVVANNSITISGPQSIDLEVSPFTGASFNGPITNVTFSNNTLGATYTRYGARITQSLNNIFNESFLPGAQPLFINETAATINYTQPVNLSLTTNLSRVITIGANSIFVNSTNASGAQLNRTADLTFSGITFANPAPFFKPDGSGFQPCEAPTCVELSYNGSDFLYSVTGFTTYTSNNTVFNFTLSKTDSIDPILNGSTETYTITVTNNGNQNLYNLSLTDIYPGQASFVGSVPAPNASNDTFLFSNLTPGQSVTVQINVTLTSDVLITVNNTVNLGVSNFSGQTVSANVTTPTTITPVPIVPAGGGGGGGTNLFRTANFTRSIPAQAVTEQPAPTTPARVPQTAPAPSARATVHAPEMPLAQTPVAEKPLAGQATLPSQGESDGASPVAITIPLAVLVLLGLAAFFFLRQPHENRPVPSRTPVSAQKHAVQPTKKPVPVLKKPAPIKRVSPPKEQDLATIASQIKEIDKLLKQYDKKLK